MKIALAQMNLIVGDFEQNVKTISNAYTLAIQKDADLLLTPELSLVGYLPLDLIERPEIFSRSLRALEKIKTLTLHQKTAVVVGWVRENKEPNGRRAENVISVIRNGQIELTQAKTLLPTYDVFDEARYFEPAKTHDFWIAPSGEKIIFAICEDLWGNDSHQNRIIYGKNPVDEYMKMNGDLLISLSASPYVYNKEDRREVLHGEIAKKCALPLLYINQVGATDEILYDGQSFALDSNGQKIIRLPYFKDSFAFFEFEKRTKNLKCLTLENSEKNNETISFNDKKNKDLDVLIFGLIVGIREYFKKTGFQKAILGLSGGIDSAVVAVLASEALGAKNVLGIAMPSEYSSAHSLMDAESLAKSLGISYEIRPIKGLFSYAHREIEEAYEGDHGKLKSIAEENLQSRLRGLILMTLSNQENALVLTTGNKSELAMGYCTLYGDMCGSLDPIGDLLKTKVYEVAHRLNALFFMAGKSSPIPQSTLEKAPSAELRPNQKDEDSLPPYSELDLFLEKYLEASVSIEQLEKEFSFTHEILRKLEFSEFKRKQAAPVLKVTSKAFGVGRRVPIAKVWDRLFSV